MHVRRIRLTCAQAAWLALTAMASAASADAGNAALENGRKLVADTKCEACHSRKVGGDGTAIYTRPDRRVNSRGKLQSQVARCNAELNLRLFPDDEAAIVAYLNATHYKFKD